MENENALNLDDYVVIGDHPNQHSSLTTKALQESKEIYNHNNDIEAFTIKLKENYSEDKIFSPLIFEIFNNKSHSERVKNKAIYLLYSLLKKKNIDFRLLRRLTFEGVPDEFPGIRSIIWRLMLNYLPSSIKDWKDYIVDRKSDYENIKSDFLEKEGQYPFSDNYFLSEIIKDIKRTRTHMHFFTSKCSVSETHMDVLTRILFIFGKIHPDVAYVQGMNELVAVIYYSFSRDPNPFFLDHLESDVFYCFENLMLELKEVFQSDKDLCESGIHNKINNISYLLESHDPQLYEHFKIEKIELEYFMFRWYTLLFTQEFNMPETIRIWDSILTQNDKFEFVSYLCLAIVVINRQVLLNKDFSNIMFVMQKLDLLDISIEKLISTAVELKIKLSNFLKYLSNTVL
jgi:hypothetical protein